MTERQTVQSELEQKLRDAGLAVEPLYIEDIMECWDEEPESVELMFLHERYRQFLRRSSPNNKQQHRQRWEMQREILIAEGNEENVRPYRTAAQQEADKKALGVKLRAHLKRIREKRSKK